MRNLQKKDLTNTYIQVSDPQVEHLVQYSGKTALNIWEWFPWVKVRGAK
jgi:hypothetical protein